MGDIVMEEWEMLHGGTAERGWGDEGTGRHQDFIITRDACLHMQKRDAVWCRNGHLSQCHKLCVMVTCPKFQHTNHKNSHVS